MSSFNSTLTAEGVRAVLSYDQESGIFTRLKTGLVVMRLKKDGYAKVNLHGGTVSAHRLAWFYVHGEWPDGQIDHINRVRSDNRIVNLRVVTPSQNQHNTGIPKNNASGHKGVCFCKRKRKWRAYIKARGKVLSLGYFDNIEDAAAARSAASKQLHNHPFLQFHAG